jgi:Zn-finger protein
MSIKKLRSLKASSIWKCYRCNLIFYEESIASLHEEISNHSSTRLNISAFGL